MICAALAVCLLLLVACSNSPPRAEPAAEDAPAAAPPVAIVEHTVEPPPSAEPSPSASVVLTPELPRADLYDLARRYRGLDVTAPPPTQPPAARVGETRPFFIYDLQANQPVEVRATLLTQTDHADIWAQDGQRMSRQEAERAGRIFESDVYPRVTAAFGAPAPALGGAPGRISILHVGLRGAGGYFSGGDQLPRALAPYSNEQQMVYLDLAAARPGNPGYAGLLAHEFQHLVHQQRNPHADTWLNEGLSEVADEMLGGGNAFLRRFETAPDTQLNAWPAHASTAPHYGAAHSFLRYLLHRFGGVDRAKDLAGIAANGVNSVEQYLRRDFNTGFLDVFADWTVANLLDEEEGRYSQPEISHRVRAIDTLPASGSGTGTVSQFGTRYLEIDADRRDLTIRFDGAEQVRQLPPSPVSGQGLWWSNRADSLNSTLTREVDLRSVRAATLRFKLWFDIEQDYDYAYVAASRDGGRTWQALPGRHTTDRDPLRIAYGPGYSGRSGGGESATWVDEVIDLSPFAGEQILLRFEYVTDEATVADGLAIDDLSIAEIGLRDAAETDGGWQPSGFLRISGPLAQRFIVQLVEQRDGAATTVRRIDLDAANDAQITIPRTAGTATLLVSGATLGTNEPASYRWEVRP
jgi:immune inhibitor A